jgi:hypothetical protein
MYTTGDGLKSPAIPALSGAVFCTGLETRNGADAPTRGVDDAGAVDWNDVSHAANQHNAVAALQRNARRPR